MVAKEAGRKSARSLRPKNKIEACGQILSACLAMLLLMHSIVVASRRARGKLKSLKASSTPSSRNETLSIKSRSSNLMFLLLLQKVVNDIILTEYFQKCHSKCNSSNNTTPNSRPKRLLILKRVLIFHNERIMLSQLSF